MRPLDPCDGAQYLEDGSAVGVAGVAAWDEIADEIRRHLETSGRVGALGNDSRVGNELVIYEENDRCQRARRAINSFRFRILIKSTG